MKTKDTFRSLPFLYSPYRSLFTDFTWKNYLVYDLNSDNASITFQ